MSVRTQYPPSCRPVLFKSFVRALILSALFLSLGTHPAAGQPACNQNVGCVGGGSVVLMSCIEDPVCVQGGANNPPECLPLGCGEIDNCKRPEVTSQIAVVPTAGGTFEARLMVDAIARWNLWAATASPNGTVDVVWWAETSVPAPCESGTQIGLCHHTTSDHMTSWVVRTGLTCAGAPYDFGTYSAQVRVCAQPCTCPFEPDCLCMPGRQTWEDVNGLVFTVTPEMLGCNVPPKKSSCNTQSCNTCPAPGVSAAGGGPALGGDLGGGALGPGKGLTYAAGGVGDTGQPGAAAHGAALGRGWIHDYGERIAVDPGPGHVWLLTRWGTYVEWTDASSDGVYETASPSDDYRTLTYNAASGWQLTELDGTVHAFDLSGRWASTTDRFGNATISSYNGTGQLETVTMPDGRSWTLAYQPYGKLASITDVGVGASPTRTWTYTWTGADLKRVNRPDGKAVELFYDDLEHPGFVTRVELVGPLAGSTRPRRVLRAFEYDAEGNVIRTWRGATTFAAGVDQWQLAFDNPANPAETMVTDPLGQVITYFLGRDVGSEKPRVERIEGDCPVCDSGPNSEYVFGDPTHPLLPTQETDGEGNVTIYTFNENGRMTTKTEAFGTPLERLTEWEYDTTYPALVTTERRPSTSGLPTTFRETTFAYNTEGAMTSRTETGVEGGQPFVYVTAYTPNAAGQPEAIDPPGYGTADVVTFTYDPTRGNLIPLTRTDPLVGTTTYAYDGYNRRTGITDPNDVIITTAYDALDRVTEVRQLGASPPTGDLVTRHFYNPFGDLFCTVLPRNNASQVQYDTAGRLTETRRGTAVTTPSGTSCLNTSLTRERMIYTLNGVGQRTNEKQEHSTGTTTWATDGETTYVYSTRCYLDQVIQAPGQTEEAVTEYDYDCNGRLERMWDANHPSSSQTAAATTIYDYDELDRLITVQQPWEEANPATTTYAYDVQDHLTAVTDAEDNTTTYTYSDRDLMTGETSPVSGTTTRTYNEHSQPLVETDARNVVTTRTHDALDRVTLIDVPAADQDTSFVYDDPLVPFSKGRLTQITRGSEVVDYTYDRFGRTLQDGALSYSWDANGNRSTIVYPGQVTAVYSFDFADRPVTLTVQRPGEPNQAIASSGSYRPFGPLQGLTLGNGLAETRTFDFRYAPTSIEVKQGSTFRLDWNYMTDDVSNITQIDQLEPTPTSTRTYGYRDVQYFLTSAAGPWPGPLAWTYDKIGNRLSETRAAATDTYQYVQNGNGNTPILESVQLSTLGTRSYTYGPAGHLELVNAAGNVINFDNDDTGQLSRLERTSAGAQVNMTYDGRGLLALATEPSTESNLPAVIPSEAEGSLGRGLAARGVPGTPIFADGFESGGLCEWSAFIGIVIPEPDCPKPPPPQVVTPTYGADGLLYALTRSEAPADVLYFYFHGRPVAQLEIDGPNETFKWITTDHLGTPAMLSSLAGATLWSAGFEPFGADYGGASAQNLFLRFPGQWEEGTWSEASAGAGVYQNVHRWYLFGDGRYSRKDPVGDVEMRQDRPWYPRAELERFSLFNYVDSNPISFLDPLGLLKFKGCTPEREARISRSFREACALVGDGDFVDCMCENPSIPRGLRRLCAQNNRTIRCQTGRTGPCADKPNLVECGWSIPFGRTIRVCEDAWSPSCGPLRCTLVHEMTHQLGHGGESKPDTAEACLGGC